MESSTRQSSCSNAPLAFICNCLHEHQLWQLAVALLILGVPTAAQDQWSLMQYKLCNKTLMVHADRLKLVEIIHQGKLSSCSL